MDRRVFIKAHRRHRHSATLASCGNPGTPDHSLHSRRRARARRGRMEAEPVSAVPGGLRVIVRVMEGDAEVVRTDRPASIRMGLAKKLEGNPAHPISQGELCARGQAAIQVTYHPDRLTHPLKRIGPRGSGQFQEVSWDDARRSWSANSTRCATARTSGRWRF